MNIGSKIYKIGNSKTFQIFAILEAGAHSRISVFTQVCTVHDDQNDFFS